MKTLLVSLVSDQTIPNVLFIKEYMNSVDEYLFISTQVMEEKKTRQWIIDAVQLLDEKVLKPLIVDQFSFSDIENKLGSFDYDQYSKVIVNITGGTKIMSIAALGYFRMIKNAEIYYYTGRKDELIKLFPGEKEIIYLKSVVSVEEYLKAYGFQIREGKSSKIASNYTKYFFERYIKEGEQYKPIIKQLQNKRGKKSIENNQIKGLSEFLTDVKFPASNKEELNKIEIRYLTGEWFEEYVYQSIRDEFNFDDEQIKIGLNLEKKNKTGDFIPNEFDVMFIYNNKLYTIECKTSVWVEPTEETKQLEPSKNIIADVVYKSDSLQKGFGLYPKTSIYILDPIEGSPDTDRFKKNIERANLYGIKVVGQEDLINKSFKELLA